jgi:hypothetical protein
MTFSGSHLQGEAKVGYLAKAGASQLFDQSFTSLAQAARNHQSHCPESSNSLKLTEIPELRFRAY